MKIMAGTPKYTPELKRQAVELHRKSDTTYAEVARGLGFERGSLLCTVKLSPTKSAL